MAIHLDKFTPTIEQVSADERGEIYIVNLPGDRELLLLHSVAGSMRGGHSHDVDEIVVLFTGEMEYSKRNSHGEERHERMLSGETSWNASGIIHMAKFLTDSWLIEWKIGTKKGEWENQNYEPWRQAVQANAAGR